MAPTLQYPSSPDQKGDLRVNHQPVIAIQPGLRIRPATAADLDRIVQTLADAFLDTPDARWLIPDRDARHTIYPRLCEALAGHTLYRGHIDITNDGSGVAIWHPSPDTSTDPTAYDRLITLACDRYAARFRALNATFTTHYPQWPHLYLAYLGVAPARQGQGIGSALLAHRHAALDTAGLPAFLVAVSPRSRDLYLRHRYTIATTGPFRLPDGGPPMWPMIRTPRRARQPAGSTHRWAAPAAELTDDGTITAIDNRTGDADIDNAPNPELVGRPGRSRNRS
jgi:GNAT superfamily N-acetyltransferase